MKLWNLDYESCKWRKKLVDKLVDERTETVEEVKLAKITYAENENSYKYSSCLVHTVLSWIFFTINVGGIGAYIIYFRGYLRKVFTREATITKHLNGRNKTNRTYYFYNDIIDLKDFDTKLLNIDKKDYKDIYYIGYVTVNNLLILIILTV